MVPGRPWSFARVNQTVSLKKAASRVAFFWFYVIYTGEEGLAPGAEEKIKI